MGTILQALPVLNVHFSNVVSFVNDLRPFSLIHLRLRLNIGLLGIELDEDNMTFSFESDESRSILVSGPTNAMRFLCSFMFPTKWRVA